VKILLLMMLAFGISYSSTAGEKLLKNGDFSEKDANGIPSDWSTPGFVCKAISAATALDITNGNKLGLTINSVQKSQGFIEQNVKLQPSRIYRLTGELRSSQPGIAFLQVKTNGKRFNSITSETEWQRVSVDFSVGEAQKTQILCRMLFMQESQGAVCEFRKLELTDAGTEVQATIANLLPNSSFEEGKEAVQIYAFIGNAGQNIDSGWQIVADNSFDGKQSLLMTGKQAYVWEVLNRNSFKCVFSIYLKGNGNKEEVELGLEPVYLSVQGGISIPKTVTQSFTISPEWKRYEISFKVDKEKLNGLSQVQFYRLWIRPLSSGKVWVDAAQLETGRTTASIYTSARGGNCKPFFYSNIVKGPVNRLDCNNKASQTGKLKLSIARQEAKLFNAFPVWAGIPFPRGVLFDEKAVKLFDNDGQEVPCQSRVLARRHIDGSITSLLLDFQMETGKQYTLHYGEKEEEKAETELVRVHDGKIVIDTGAVTAEINRKNFCGFTQITDKNTGQSISGSDLGCFVKTPDGKKFSSTNGQTDEVSIESNGPIHAVIRAAGKHYAADGHTMLYYIVRIHAFAGKPYFLVETTFENREYSFNTLIKAIGLELPLPDSGEVLCKFTDRSSKTIPIGKQGVEITQLHETYGAGKYDVVINADSREIISNRKAQGIFTSGKSMVAIKDFWQLNPKSVRFFKNKVSIYHWPEREVKYADLPYGMAATITIAYAPFGSGNEAAMLTGKPPLLQAEPEWIAKSAVFGNFLTAKETAEKYPRYHQCLERVFDEIQEFTHTTDLTGMTDYGEFGNLKSKKNNESVVCMNLWLQYLRGGSPELFNRARALTLHQREVDVCHAGEGACFMHTHCAAVNTSYHFHNGHFWIKGLIWHYLLTGDKRSFNTARDLGAHLLLKYRLSHYQGRERARMLLHLADLYELTHLQCFRNAYETHYNFDQPTPTGGDYYIGIGLLCLKRWYDVTGEKKYLERFIKDAYNILKLRINCNYGKDSFAKPDYGIGGGRDWYVFQAMAEAAEVTGDKKFITVFSDWFVWHMVHLTGFSVNAAQGSYFLKAAEKFDIGENPLMPDNLLGIYPMAGCFCSKFDILLCPKDRAATLRVYRVRPFRYWQTIKRKGEDSIKLKVTAPNGTELVSKTMSGPEPGQIESIKLPPVKDGEFYQLELNFINDAWGAVSSSTPDIFLKTDRSFSARMPRLGSHVFGFAAIAPEKFDISLKWWSKDKIVPMGKIFGIIIQDLTGNTIAHKRWAVPIGSCFNKGGKPAKSVVEKLNIQIPPEYQGKPVKLFIAAPKYTKWTFNNLKPPLLAPTSAGFLP
jgi:exo-rhamnogalacturonan lyase-like protein